MGFFLTPLRAENTPSSFGVNGESSAPFLSDDELLGLANPGSVDSLRLLILDDVFLLGGSEFGSGDQARSFAAKSYCALSFSTAGLYRAGSSS